MRARLKLFFPLSGQRGDGTTAAATRPLASQFTHRGEACRIAKRNRCHAAQPAALAFAWRWPLYCLRVPCVPRVLFCDISWLSQNTLGKGVCSMCSGFSFTDLAQGAGSLAVFGVFLGGILRTDHIEALLL